MTRRKPRRSPPADARARRDLVTPEVAAAYRAELNARILRHNAIVAEKARNRGWVEQPDGRWFHPVYSAQGYPGPRPYALIDDV